MAIAALTAAVGLGGCGGSDEPPTCEDPEAVTSVTMDDFSYAPGCVEAPATSTPRGSNKATRSTCRRGIKRR